jgi:probable lipoprotein NlpC
MHWSARYVGIPFIDRGYDATGCHCWGLAHLVYHRECGIVLPRHDTITIDQLKERVRAIYTASMMPPWVPVTDECRDFDVVLMAVSAKDDAGRPRRFAGHIGVAVGPRLVLHVERGTDAVCVPVNHFSIRHRLLGVWRHEALSV